MTPERPRLFISHSSQEEPLAKRLIAEVRKRVEEKLEVLLDAEVLDGGQRWRDELWGWWSECDAALVVCSPAALKSRWVMLEVSILMRRKRVNEHFPLRPLLVDPVKPDSLKTSLFGDQQLEELQLTDFTDDAAFDAKVEELAAKLLVLEVLGRAGKPLIVWEDHLAALLESVDHADTLTAAARTLGATADSWAGIPVQARIVARALLECDDREKVCHTVAALAPRLRGKVADLVDLLAPSWLTAEEVAPVAGVVDRPHGSRGVALTTWVKRMALWYVQRGTRFHRAKPIEFPMPGSADDVTEIVAHIRASVRDHLGLEEEEDDDVARRILSKREKTREPLFVLVPIDSKTRPGKLEAKLLEPIMDELRALFPTIGFFCLAGEARDSLAEAQEHGRVVFLPHDKERETVLAADYLDARSR